MGIPRSAALCVLLGLGVVVSGFNPADVSFQDDPFSGEDVLQPEYSAAKQALGGSAVDQLSAGFAGTPENEELGEGQKMQAQPTFFEMPGVDCHKATHANKLLCDAYGTDSSICMGAHTQFHMECADFDAQAKQKMQNIKRKMVHQLDMGSSELGESAQQPGELKMPSIEDFPPKAINATAGDIAAALEPILQACGEDMIKMKERCSVELQHQKNDFEEYYHAKKHAELEAAAAAHQEQQEADDKRATEERKDADAEETAAASMGGDGEGAAGAPAGEKDVTESMWAWESMLR